MSSKNTKTTTQPLDWETAQYLLKRLHHDKDYYNLLLFALGFNFGFRIKDTLNIKWEYLEKQSFTLIETKTKKPRTVEVNKYIKSLLSEVKENNFPRKRHSHIFTYRRDGSEDKPISVQAANKRIKAVFKKYSIPTANASSHTIRKTFGLRIYNNKGKTHEALKLLRDIFNHRYIHTTMTYIGVDKQAIKDAYLDINDY